MTFASFFLMEFKLQNFRYDVDPFASFTPEPSSYADFMILRLNEYIRTFKLADPNTFDGMRIYKSCMIYIYSDFLPNFPKNSSHKLDETSLKYDVLNAYLSNEIPGVITFASRAIKGLIDYDANYLSFFLEYRLTTRMLFIIGKAATFAPKAMVKVLSSQIQIIFKVIERDANFLFEVAKVCTIEYFHKIFYVHLASLDPIEKYRDLGLDMEIIFELFWRMFEKNCYVMYDFNKVFDIINLLINDTLYGLAWGLDILILIIKNGKMEIEDVVENYNLMENILSYLNVYSKREDCLKIFDFLVFMLQNGWGGEHLDAKFIEDYIRPFCDNFSDDEEFIYMAFKFFYYFLHNNPGNLPKILEYYFYNTVIKHSLTNAHVYNRRMTQRIGIDVKSYRVTKMALSFLADLIFYLDSEQIIVVFDIDKKSHNYALAVELLVSSFKYLDDKGISDGIIPCFNKVLDAFVQFGLDREFMDACIRKDIYELIDMVEMQRNDLNYEAFSDLKKRVRSYRNI